MAIRKTSSDKYMVDFMVNYTRYRQVFDTREEASHYEAEVRLKVSRGETPPASPKTVREAIKPEADSITLHDLRELTYKFRWSGSKNETAALRTSRQVVEFFGKDTPAASIDTNSLDSLIENCKDQGNSPATINRKLAALSCMLHVGWKRGLVKVIPPFERQKESKGRVRWLRKSEETQLLEAFRQLEGSDGIDCHDFTIVLLDTGLRVSEALGLDWSDIHETQSNPYLIAVDRKNGDTTGIPMTSRIRDIMATRRITHENERGPFSGVWSSRNIFNSRWNNVKNKLGFENDKHFVPHICRHTFISRLVQRGVPLRVVQELAGHKTLSMTMRYSHLAPQNLRSAIQKLED